MEGSFGPFSWRDQQPKTSGAEYHGWGPYPNPDLLVKSICSCWWNSDFWVYPVYPSLPVISAWCNMASAITFDSSLLSKSGASAPHFCSADVFSRLGLQNPNFGAEIFIKRVPATVVPPSDCTGWKKNGFMVSLEKSSIWIIIPGCFEMDSQASCFNHVWGTAQWLDGDKQPGGEKLAPSGIAHPSCESTRIHQKHDLAPFITLWYCNQTWQSIILLEWGIMGQYHQTQWGLFQPAVEDTKGYLSNIPMKSHTMPLNPHDGTMVAWYLWVVPPGLSSARGASGAAGSSARLGS